LAGPMLFKNDVYVKEKKKAFWIECFVLENWIYLITLQTPTQMQTQPKTCNLGTNWKKSKKNNGKDLKGENGICWKRYEMQERQTMSLEAQTLS